ncbi:MAG: L-seryl-tRNA(Sec) selenium transferase [Deltaproteobacteria bacterium]|nr:L-seryl-tRNA(Sec) selenium transferase [Candidatus Zymogenaceae bacterium]
MSEDDVKRRLAALPSVDAALNEPGIARLQDTYSKKLVTDAVRDVIGSMRSGIIEGRSDGDSEESFLALVKRCLTEKTATSLRPVINATGTVLHTNLGRAPLSRRALEHLVQVSVGYSNLEFNLETGERGSRYDHITELLSEITGAEGALMVNNNAAAVLLVLDTLAREREVVVSRGELVEIGGSFRIPDVLRKSGAVMVEVGTTNRTRIADYEEAITDRTALFLKVHTSNYRIVGFSESAAASELVALGRQLDIPVMEDLGSGSLVDLSAYGLPPEPTVQQTLAVGVDVVTFSGDKLLGGGQAGFIVGNKRFIERIRNNPLNRALRIDKFTLAAAEMTLREYADPVRAVEEIPTLRMITRSFEETRRTARRITRRINKTPHPGFDVVSAQETSRVGGGAYPTADLPGGVVLLIPQDITPARLEKRLRALPVPIIARISQDRVVIDPRTVDEREIPILTDGILAAFRIEDTPE